MAICYLDNSATTACCAAAAEAATALMLTNFGNPSSLHTLGIRAEEVVTDARESVAALIGATAGEITFTSGGTEANNTALIGGATAKGRFGKHVVITAVEHSSVSAAATELERRGFTVTRVPPDRDGDIAADAVADACRPDTVMVSMMLVNNETGAIFPVSDMAAKVRAKCPNVLIHCDAVQAAGKMPVNVKRLGVDLLTVSAHKLHGPKGCGALYIRKGVRILPLIHGGEQEKGLRGGTEAVPLIGGFGAALRTLAPPPKQREQLSVLCDRLVEALKTREGIVLHLPKQHLPAIVNLSVLGIRSETMLHFLAAKDIYVSSGSACAKGKPSEVLTAMGLSKAEADSAIRVSFDTSNTVDDVDRFVTALDEGMRTLARAR